MKVIRFPNKTLPWRIIVPPTKSPTGKRRAYYFKTKEQADDFLQNLRMRGSAPPKNVDETEVEDASQKIFAKIFSNIDTQELFWLEERLLTLLSLVEGILHERLNRQ